MNVLVVENERPAAEKLKRLLKKIDNSITVAGVTESVESTLNWMQVNPSPDLILMDIQLDDGICFELFDTMTIETPVIFTTAYNEFAIRAFRVNSVDYLLKPVEEDDLRRAIEKFKTFHGTSSGDLFKQLFTEFNRQYKNRFLVKIGTHYRSVQVKEILCFYILERATFIKTFSGREYGIDNSLDFIQKIIDPETFFRLNRNCLINIHAIDDILSYSSSRLQVRLKAEIPPLGESWLVVSREMVAQFKRWIDK